MWLLCAAGAAAAAPAGTLPETVEFNRDIRPILSDRCYTCHGPDLGNRKTALRFDTEEGARIELRNHRFAIVAGKPDESEMYRRIVSGDKAVRMPPAYMGKEKLTGREIALIRRWIEQGARWEKHWSFIPPRRLVPPAVRGAAWARNAIDRFVLSRLEREGLAPAPEAPKNILIRRVTLDLTGLPPTPAEVDAFVGDTSPGAYERLVDRLLASPRYGERMAIRWLEAARYADTNGYQTDGPRDMWRWRDWVIDAFNRNMPFDEFTVAQIAGDLLPHPRLDQVIATAFHRNHRTSGEGGIIPEEFRTEYVAERTATTATVWLGLTLGCARCHDHKYDPIPQRDFYRMFAYFNSVPEKGLVYNFGNEEPYVKAPTPEQSRRLAELDRQAADAEKAYAALQAKLAKAQGKWERRLEKSKPFDWKPSAGLELARELDGADGRFDGTRIVEAGDIGKFDYLDPFTLSAWINPSEPNGAILTRGEDYFEGEGYGLYLVDGKLWLHINKRWTDISLRVETEEPVALGRWQHVTATYDGQRKSEGVHIYVDGQPRKLKVLFDDLNYPLSYKDPFRIGGGGGPKLRFHGAIGGVRVYSRALSPEEVSTLPVRRTPKEIAAIAAASRSAGECNKLALCFLDRFAPRRIREARDAAVRARLERDRFYAAIPTVMVMQDMPHPRDTFVLKRGAYDAPGEKVTPGTPTCLPPMPPGAPPNRLGLARWLVDRSNPLTARVTVNRFWQMYFGTGLVKTVEDFGSQGDWPVYQDVLDWLAVEFMESGWDVKHIQKTIVMSAAYRQSSKVSADLLQRDPENRLLARGPRLRLPAEMIRDQALYMAGLLVEKVGGPSVKPYQPPGLWKELAGGKDYQADHGEGLYRRSLYTYWKRTVAPPAMVLFDSPNRETCAVSVTRTNTPLQALDLMNGVTYVEASRKLAERMLREGGATPDSRIAFGWRLATARAPQPAELAVARAVLEKFAPYYRTHKDDADELLSEGESAPARRLKPAELAAYTGLASLILNLDETITKE